MIYVLTVVLFMVILAALADAMRQDDRRQLDRDLDEYVERSHYWRGA